MQEWPMNVIVQYVVVSTNKQPDQDPNTNLQWQLQSQEEWSYECRRSRKCKSDLESVSAVPDETRHVIFSCQSRMSLRRVRRDGSDYRVRGRDRNTRIPD